MRAGSDSDSAVTSRAASLGSIADIVRQAASSATPGTLCCDGRRTRYDQLDARTNRVARGLASLAERGTRVGVLDTNSDVFLELLFGAAKAGVVLVPLNYRLTPVELRSIAEHAGLEVLFAGSEFAGAVAELRESCPTLTRVVWLDGTGDEGFEHWRDAHPATETGVVVERGDVALQVYTSGTVGEPKGVLLTHESLLTGVPMLDDEYVCAPGRDVALVCMPVYHVSGCLWALTCMYSGLDIVVLRRISSSGILGAIAEHRVTIALLVPTVIQMLLAAPERGQLDLTSLRMMLYGGSSISPTVMAQALATFPCDFGQVYGLTESGGAVTYLSPSDHRQGTDEQRRSCGRPLRQASLRIVDADGVDVPQGQVGEIVCRSRQNMAGYWRRGGGEEGFAPGGWLRTGDLGHADTDGYLYIHDRLDDMIVSGGENVYPSEVEAALLAHPSVADAGVVGVRDERWGARVVAFVVGKPGSAVTDEELSAFLRQRLAAYKLPKSIVRLAALPRNAAGKLLRRQLREDGALVGP